MSLLNIPRAPGLPILGNSVAMGRDIQGFLLKQYRELGPIFHIRLVNRRFIVLAGIEANRFLQRDGSRHLRSFENWVGLNAEFGAANSILTSDGSDHAKFRRVLKRGYSRRFAQDHVPELVEIARQKIAGWPRGAPFAVVPAIRQIASEQVGVLSTGVSPTPYADDLALFVHELLASLIVPRIMRRRGSRFRRASARMNDLYREVIERHAGSESGPNGHQPDLIDDILTLHRTDPSFMPEADLKMAVLGPFIAALDTVASTCSFMLYELLKNPDVLIRARKEADQLIAAGPSAWSELQGLDVMHRAALETMRMHPVAPLLMRTVANSFDFADCTVPAGASVMIATSLPHRLPEFFPDPDRFDIERYTPERAEHRQTLAYAPFGLGTHRCLGNGFAEVQTAVMMATILSEVDLELRPATYRLKTAQIPLPAPTESFRVVATTRAMSDKGAKGITHGIKVPDPVMN